MTTRREVISHHCGEVYTVHVVDTYCGRKMGWRYFIINRDPIPDLGLEKWEAKATTEEQLEDMISSDDCMMMLMRWELGQEEKRERFEAISRQKPRRWTESELRADDIKRLKTYINGAPGRTARYSAHHRGTTAGIKELRRAKQRLKSLERMQQHV